MPILPANSPSSFIFSRSSLESEVAMRTDDSSGEYVFVMMVIQSSKRRKISFIRAS
jgi:hypothetical protein